MKLVVILIFVTAALTSQSAASSQLCPRSCRCEVKNTVHCNDKGLHIVPYGIPATTRVLHIQDNAVRNGRITNENLSQLKKLQTLNMHSNLLTAIPGNLPTSLEEISLRNNDIKFVGKNSLKGLQSLVELQLDGNNITNQGLSPIAFDDCTSLKFLEMTNNLLESVPEFLPRSLRVLQLKKNKINRITFNALSHLSSLEILDLSENSITLASIEGGAFASLSSLDRLLMGGNQLTGVPRDLPASLTQVVFSRNKIEYIHSSNDLTGEQNDDVDFGSLSHLDRLTSLGLSTNLIKSVEKDAFKNLRQLRTLSIYGNAWQCDCHLRYFKRWLTNSNVVLSDEQNIKCASPETFSGVTLNSIDVEALRCDASSKERFQIVNVTSENFKMVWKPSPSIPDPPFIKRHLLYGPLRCQNCSLDDVTKSPGHFEIQSIVHKYRSIDFLSNSRGQGESVVVTVDQLQPATHYVVCVCESDQKEPSISQCEDVWTGSLPTTSGPEEVTADEHLPTTWIILACCLAAAIVLLLLIAAVVWRRKMLLRKVKGKRTNHYSTRHSRNDFYPESYIPGYTRPPQQPPRLGYVTNVDSYATNASDRTYMECGEADATNEFDVTLVAANEIIATRPKVFVSSQNHDISSCRLVDIFVSSYIFAADQGGSLYVPELCWVLSLI